MTISFAPLFRASNIKRAIWGCCSVVFEPITKITSVPASSAIEFVIAPEPKAELNPITLDE